MTRLVDIRDELNLRRTFGFLDDFEWYVTAHRWASVISDAGTVSVGDAARGVLALVASDATVADNDETYLKSANECFLFANDKPLVAEARVQYTEANVSAANIVFGLMDAVAADALLDNGGGPKASYSGALIYKVDGETVWRCQSSIATTKNTTKTTKTAGGAAYQVLSVEFRPITSTAADIIYYIDGVQVAKDSFTYSSATEMQLLLGVKNGSTSLETLNVDYAACFQLR